MRRLLLCLAAGLAVAAALAAAPLEDCLSFLAGSAPFRALMEGLWNTEDAAVCQGLYDAVLDEADSKADGAEGLCLALKADVAMARYWACGPYKSARKARACLKAALGRLERLDGAYAPARLATLAEIRGLEYTISPLALGKGLEAKRLTERAYKENPGEVSAVLMYANSRLYAPALAGRDVDEALRLFERLQSFPALSPWDRFSVRSGLGMCLKSKGRGDEARSWLSKAMEIYHGDTVIIKALKELGRQPGRP